MPVLPGSTIGIFGGGQLGRMLALAARPLGYRLVVLDPDPNCAARSIVDECITAAFDDAQAAQRLASRCAVITLEIEKIGPAALAAASSHTPVRPSANVLHIVQDRGRQKQWLSQNGFPVTPWRLVTTARELGAAAAELGDGAFVKAAHGGYDGRGQDRLRHDDDFDSVWNGLGAGPCVVERAVELREEISVLVARRPRGESVTYAPALNHHEHRILSWSVLPAPISNEQSQAAQQLATRIGAALDVVGLLVVEMFVTKDGELIVNELAPRPHNSYHESTAACVTNQFEQAIRAVCDLPLGSAEIVRPAAICNLLGDLWQSNRVPNIAAALAISGVTLHLYGKSGPRPGRKMGHLMASASTAAEAIKRAQQAYAAL